MASIENRSRFVVSVKNREDLTQTFAYNRDKQLKAYIAKLKADGYKPKLVRTNDSFAIRVRDAGHLNQCLYAHTEQEAVDIKQRLELERRNGLFVDYAKGRSVTFADLLARYLREVSPRHKGFEVEGYIINALLSDAGLPRVDIAQAYADHKNPHPSLAGKAFRKPSGRKMRVPSPASCFIRKPFADIVPDDFNDYIDDRCMSVETRSLTWDSINFNEQTAFIPESKNGRPRTLALRKDILVLLQQLPRDDEKVFPMSLDALCKAWARICKAADLMGENELHVHDLRHEAISRVADAGGRLPGGFSLVDLQAFSGHRDTRMLLRYTHLCMPSLAKRLDEAFADKSQTVVHRGQRRLRKGAQLSMKDLTTAQPKQPPALIVASEPAARPCNVVPFRLRAAA
ncbi:integrase [Janthinobacterium sp. BJB301]|uniref:site-specific integrase n=1 Tax=Janthinobacterium sp. BJB301 TaxID=1560195 RepID=UPI000C11BBD1|nr:site-specific integrase [Janthinobacterium sp. BJB301]PHV48369.1 integrase [Janthinobacterium sp. BJB301]